MTFRQERLVFDGTSCIDVTAKFAITQMQNDIAKEVWGKQGYTVLAEEEYLNNIAAEGWVLHTANYSVLGKQEVHYFLFVKE